MSMDTELKGVFDRADELLRELQEEYQRCLATPLVTERAKNLFHEVLIKLRSALDMTMYRAWNKYGKPKMLESKWRKVEKRIYFPISDDQKKYDKWLKECCLSLLCEDNKQLYEAIKRAQPWSTKRSDLCYLRDLANLAKHVRLVPQVAKARPARRAVGPQGTVEFTEGVEFHMEQVMGAPVNPKTHQPMPTEDVDVSDFTMVSFEVKDYDVVDPVIFCASLCSDTRRFVERLMGCM